MEKSIFKQLESLTPEEIKFLKESMQTAYEYLSNYVKDQENSLDKLNTEGVSPLYEYFIGTKEERIDKITEALKKNKENLIMVAKLRDKFNNFEGIV